jgi:hypothetical protein
LSKLLSLVGSGATAGKTWHDDYDPKENAGDKFVPWLTTAVAKVDPNVVEAKLKEGVAVPSAENSSGPYNL